MRGLFRTMTVRELKVWVSNRIINLTEHHQYTQSVRDCLYRLLGDHEVSANQAGGVNCVEPNLAANVP
jgi:hypothetical protein